MYLIKIWYTQQKNLSFTKITTEYTKTQIHIFEKHNFYINITKTIA